MIVALDADLQNDPEDIPDVVQKLQEGYDVVSCWRKDRQDPWLTRVLPSRLANRLISWISGVHLHDYGCTLKGYRRHVLQHIRLYGEMHRFIPIFASWAGARVVEIPVRHHPSGLGSVGQRDNANARKLAINLAKETVQVGSALGFNVEPVRGLDADTWNQADDGEVFEEIDAKMLGRKAEVDWRSSMAQDVYKRRRSEIDYMNGYVVRKGREANVPTPASAAVVEGMHKIDSGAWQQDPANIDKVLGDAGLL
jgi:glycosyltransferase involved in cell wall biosynthesis